MYASNTATSSRLLLIFVEVGLGPSRSHLLQLGQFMLGRISRPWGSYSLRQYELRMCCGPFNTRFITATGAATSLVLLPALLPPSATYVWDLGGVLSPDEYNQYVCQCHPQRPRL
jgi:hypothetical protein